MDALPFDAHHVDGVHGYLNASSSKLDKLIVRQCILSFQLVDCKYICSDVANDETGQHAVAGQHELGRA